MTNPKQATSRGSKRFYTWREENYWSVTTILQAVAKPALINWAKKFTAEYAVAHIDSLVQLVNDDPDGAIDWLKGAAYRDRDKKADLGSAVHAATEAYVLNKPYPDWPALIKPRMLAFQQFLEQHEPEFVATEASVYNRSERYAGTLDGIVRFKGLGDGLLVGDYKTGKAIYPEVALQLAAYRNAEFIGLPDGSEAPMHPTVGAFGLHLPSEGGYELVDVDTGPEVFQTFLFCREMFRWAEQGSKRVLRGPLETSGGQAELDFKEAVA